ncbi:ABC transporter permease [Pontibacter sp. Tf4]|uniref:ABC transporter permease n=1 Tax=Pontibacter sp. Tf4 TaxID=2761620 RepID=UPI001627FA06|nr:ABC transporter permease [Pontibacter sp. Tf4]MBB6611031.1 ABC transporter permease [Pontibacter sp. Tf4]
MIKHLFKLVWNRRRANFLMILAIFFSFIVLFGTISVLVNSWRNYNKPMGFEAERIWYVNIQSFQTPKDEARTITEQLVRRLQTLPEIESVALASGNAAYSGWSSVSGLQYKNLERGVNSVTVQGGDFQKTMDLNLTEGRWFQDGDAQSNQNPVLITQDVKEFFFGEEPATGKKLSTGQSELTVIGVVDHYRTNGELNSDDGTFFRATSLNDTTQVIASTLYLRMKPGVTSGFEEKLLKEAGAVATGWKFDVKYMDQMRSNYLKEYLTPIVAFAIICAFLILNVALGIFGVLWYNINKRYSEIGLRRALGATANQIYKQFLGEILVLATLGLVLGSFFAIQFVLLDVMGLQPEVYYYALGISILVIYLLVIVCAFQPSRQAAAIHPAIALHEE